MYNQFRETWSLSQPVSGPAQISRVFLKLRVDCTIDIIHCNVIRAHSRMYEETVSFDMVRLTSGQQIEVRLGQFPIDTFESLRYFLEMQCGVVVAKRPKFRIFGALKTVGFEGGPSLVASYQKAHVSSSK